MFDASQNGTPKEMKFKQAIKEACLLDQTCAEPSRNEPTVGNSVSGSVSSVRKNSNTWPVWWIGLDKCWLQSLANIHHRHSRHHRQRYSAVMRGVRYLADRYEAPLPFRASRAPQSTRWERDTVTHIRRTSTMRKSNTFLHPMTMIGVRVSRFDRGELHVRSYHLNTYVQPLDRRYYIMTRCIQIHKRNTNLRMRLSSFCEAA